MSIDELFKKLVDDSVTADDFAKCAKLLGFGLPEVFNKISLLFASQFIGQHVSYNDADAAINMVWSAMLDYVLKNDLKIIEPCHSIYLAFDAGEYDHHDGFDPVARYTIPMLYEILKSSPSTV